MMTQSVQIVYNQTSGKTKQKLLETYIHLWWIGGHLSETKYELKLIKYLFL